MKTFLKYATTFLAGGASFAYLYARACYRDTKFPIEGTIEFEDENMKVTRMCRQKPKDDSIHMATIVYKNQTTNEES